MLTHYFELRAIPQIEIDEVNVINQIMQSLHLILVNQKGKIAIHFPCYSCHGRKTLGGIVRLFGQESELQLLQQTIKQHNRIHDYAVILDILPIPSSFNGYVQVSRVQSKGQSALRRAKKRLTKQGKWSEEVQQSMTENWGNNRLNYPHMHLTSHSTGQRFMLWIKQQHFEQPQSGEFNSYGLSQTATVPNF